MAASPPVGGLDAWLAAYCRGRMKDQESGRIHNGATTEQMCAGGCGGGSHPDDLPVAVPHAAASYAGSKRPDISPFKPNHNKFFVHDDAQRASGDPHAGKVKATFAEEVSRLLAKHGLKAFPSPGAERDRRRRTVEVLPTPKKLAFDCQKNKQGENQPLSPEDCVDNCFPPSMFFTPEKDKVALDCQKNEQKKDTPLPPENCCAQSMFSTPENNRDGICAHSRQQMSANVTTHPNSKCCASGAHTDSANPVVVNRTVRPFTGLALSMTKARSRIAPLMGVLHSFSVAIKKEADVRNSRSAHDAGSGETFGRLHKKADTKVSPPKNCFENDDRLPDPSHPASDDKANVRTIPPRHGHRLIGSNPGEQFSFISDLTDDDTYTGLGLEHIRSPMNQEPVEFMCNPQTGDGSNEDKPRVRIGVDPNNVEQQQNVIPDAPIGARAALVRRTTPHTLPGIRKDQKHAIMKAVQEHGGMHNLPPDLAQILGKYYRDNNEEEVTDVRSLTDSLKFPCKQPGCKDNFDDTMDMTVSESVTSLGSTSNASRQVHGNVIKPHPPHHWTSSGTIPYHNWDDISGSSGSCITETIVECGCGCIYNRSFLGCPLCSVPNSGTGDRFRTFLPEYEAPFDMCVMEEGKIGSETYGPIADNEAPTPKSSEGTGVDAALMEEEATTPRKVDASIEENESIPTPVRCQEPTDGAITREDSSLKKNGRATKISIVQDGSGNATAFTVDGDPPEPSEPSITAPPVLHDDGDHRKLLTRVNEVSLELSEPSTATTPAFLGEQDFRKYFDNRGLRTMRSYLVRYTPKPDELRADPGYLYHQVQRGVSENDIPGHFYNTFRPSDFVMDGGKVKPNPRTMRQVSQILESIVEEHEIKFQVAKKKRDHYKWKWQSSREYDKNETSGTNIRPGHKAAQQVLKKSREYKDLTADGGPTNGEFTAESQLHLFERMSKQGMTSRDVACDLGAAHGGLVAAMANYFDIPAVGYEISEVRAYLAGRFLSDLLDDDNVPMKRFGYCVGDLSKMKQFYPLISVAYGFDHAIDEATREKFWKWVASMPGVWMIVSGIHDLGSLGFEEVDKVRCKMYGSGEVKHMTIWKKFGTEVRATSTSLPQDGDARTNILNRMLFGGNMARAEEFRALQWSARITLEEGKRRRKYGQEMDIQGSKCQRARFKQCPGKCDECMQYFRFYPGSVEVAASPIHGHGLFATENIAANKFVAMVPGKWVEELPGSSTDRKRTLQLVSDDYGAGFLKLDQNGGQGGDTLYMPVNHTCEKHNAVLLEFVDKHGLKKYGVVTCCSVEANAEITIHYGPHFPGTFDGGCGCPACRITRETKNVMLCGMKCGSLGHHNSNGTRKTLETVYGLVARKEWTDMDGRDTNRIMQMERLTGFNVFTVNKARAGAAPRSLSHIETDFKADGFVHSIFEQLLAWKHDPVGFFTMIMWDWFWNPPGWNKEKWGAALYKKHLVALAELLADDGCIWMPFHIDVLENSVTHEKSWITHYHVDLIHHKDVRTNLLWRATEGLDECDLYGKSNSVSSVHACDIKGVVEAYPMSELMSILKRLGDKELPQIRFIRFKKRKLVPIIGGEAR